jgi:hypothetical protein
MLANKRSLVRLFLHVTAVAAMMVLAVVPPAQASSSDWQVVASGLNNPRGLNIGPDGALYVTEAGTGGSGLCVPGPEGGEVCFGDSGSVTRVHKGHQQRIITGLPSLADATGDFAIGPSDISFVGRNAAYVTIGLGANPELRAQFGELGMHLGTMMRINLNGFHTMVADVAAYEASANPDGGEVDSNPHAVAGRLSKAVVADAGANAAVVVEASGISTLAVFTDEMVEAPPFLGLPPGTLIPMQAVPNTVAFGPDGAVYVGTLTGFPFPVGGAKVFRVVPGEAPTVFADGFTNIIDIAFGADGSLYVLEIAHNSLLSGDPTGALIQVAPDSTRSTIAMEGLVFPTSFTIAKDGSFLVSNFGTFAGIGQVVRIPANQ